MKKLITIVSVMATALIFTACGGGGGGGTAGGTTAGTSGGTTEVAGGTTAGTSGGTTEVAGGTTVGTSGGTVEDSVTIESLTIGVPTPVGDNYAIVESSDDAVVEILVTGETKTVTLIKGSASIQLP